MNASKASDKLLESSSNLVTAANQIASGGNTDKAGQIIDEVLEALPIILEWIQEEKSREGKSADEITKRNEELGSEVERMNKEDLKSST